MFSVPFTALLGLVLLTSPSRATGPTPLPTCEVGTRYIELTVEGSPQPPEVCIRPDLSLTLFFDATLASVDVEGRDRFRRVEVGPTLLTLVASKALRDGERVPVTVSFLDSAAPTRAAFMLVVHPSQAERQVEVSRHERTLDSLRQGEQQARAEAQQCREEMARLQAEATGQGGLTGLIVREWVGEAGVRARKLNDMARRPEDVLMAINVISYRAIGSKGRGRVAVEMTLWNQGAAAWTPMGAALVGATGEELQGLTVWPPRPIPPGYMQRLVVEREATEHEARGSFTLKLWAAEAGAGHVLIEDVTFP